jgi:hypothetical protein
MGIHLDRKTILPRNCSFHLFIYYLLHITHHSLLDLQPTSPFFSLIITVFLITSHLSLITYYSSLYLQPATCNLLYLFLTIYSILDTVFHYILFSYTLYAKRSTLICTLHLIFLLFNWLIGQ